ADVAVRVDADTAYLLDQPGRGLDADVGELDVGTGVRELDRGIDLLDVASIDPRVGRVDVVAVPAVGDQPLRRVVVERVRGRAVAEADARLAEPVGQGPLRDRARLAVDQVDVVRLHA